MMSDIWWASQRGEPARDHELMALRFLAHGPHCVGVVDDEDKLAAALTFIALAKRGWAIATITDNGPEYRLTPAGHAEVGRDG